MQAVSFHRLARRELNATARYYESESPGLGQRFLDATERSVQGIVEFPDAGQELLGAIRRRLVHGFPYAVLYRVHSQNVRILAIMNLKRQPMYWVGRE